MDRQAVYNQVRDHLLQQNAQARRLRAVPSGGTQCAYRSPDGLKCAVGCLITDEHYTEELEGHDALNFKVCGAVEKSLGISLGPDDVEFLIRLQSVHDYYKPEEWKGQLERFAVARNLQP